MIETPLPSNPNRERLSDTRSRDAEVRAALAELVLVFLGLAVVALQLLASPKLRDVRLRTEMQGLVRELLALCLRMAFRRGLKAGLALASVLRGTAWAERAELVEKVAGGLERASALPALDAPDVSVIAARLARWLRRASRRAVARARGIREDTSRRGALVRVASCEGVRRAGWREAARLKNAAARPDICASYLFRYSNI